MKNKECLIPRVEESVEMNESIADASTGTVGEISNLEPESSGGGSEIISNSQFR